MMKKILLWAVLAAAVLAGALLRVLPEGSGGAGKSKAGRFVFVFNGDVKPGGFIEAPLRIESPGEGPAASPAAPRPARVRKPGAPRKPDLDAIKKGISPKGRKAGDMKDYLDDAERTRAERVRKSLKEIKDKVRDWQPSIFEPTW
ncbi:MAG: hypothetical protein ACOX5A_06670 [Aminivibrio sp.]|jgi:hypothetical protein